MRIVRRPAWGLSTQIVREDYKNTGNRSGIVIGEHKIQVLNKKLLKQFIYTENRNGIMVENIKFKFSRTIEADHGVLGLFLSARRLLVLDFRWQLTLSSQMWSSCIQARGSDVLAIPNLGPKSS